MTVQVAKSENPGGCETKQLKDTATVTVVYTLKVK